MASKEYPEIWLFFIENLIPGGGEGYDDLFLNSKFESMINDLLDSDCENEKDICTILASHVIMPRLFNGRDKVDDELSEMIDHIYKEEFEDLYTTYILPIKSSLSDDEEPETENAQSDDESEKNNESDQSEDD